MSTVIESQPIAVTVFDNTPTVTVEDHNTGSIVVTGSGCNSAKIISNQATQVIVSTGIGNGYDTAVVLGMLEGNISYDLLDTTLQLDIDHARNLWDRLGYEDVLLAADGSAIYQASVTYTDQQISSVVTMVDATNDDVTTLESRVDQEAGRIDLNVARIDTHDGEISSNTGRITITETDLDLAVTRITDIDGPGGALEVQSSAISLNADSIDLAVVDITQNGDDIITNGAHIQINADTITEQVTSINDLTGLYTEVRTELTANSATTQIIESYVGSPNYSLEATETMLSTQWGVSITETSAGNAYVTGMGVILHPSWLNAHVYEVDDSIYFYNTTTDTGSVYSCILAHTSSPTNNPSGISGATYWVDDEGTKSSFVVQAETFQVRHPDDTFTPVFTIVGNDVAINGDLIVTGSITVGWSDVVDDGNKPNDNADVTADEIGSVPAGNFPASLQNAYTTLVDIGIDYSGSTTEIDGGTIRTNTVYAAAIVAGSTFSQNLYVGNELRTSTSGYIIGGTKDYSDIFTDSGFFLGYHGGNYRFVIGDIAADGIYYSGSTLQIFGDVVVAGNIKANNVGDSSGYTGTTVASASITVPAGITQNFLIVASGYASSGDDFTNPRLTLSGSVTTAIAESFALSGNPVSVSISRTVVKTAGTYTFTATLTNTNGGEVTSIGVISLSNTGA